MAMRSILKGLKLSRLNSFNMLSVARFPHVVNELKFVQSNLTNYS